MEKLSSNEIKIKNRQLIYHHIRNHQSASKQDIVVALQLSLPTVTQNLEYLKEQGLIDTSKKIKNTGGRNATAFSYVKDARASIGVYLSAHYMSAVALNMSGEIMEVCEEKIPFNLDDDAYLRKVGALVEKVKEQAKIGDRLLGVAIALPGLVSSEGDYVTYGRTLGFTGKKLKDVAKYIPYECRLFHDANVAGRMEAWLNKELNNAFYISLNSSVGGALVVDNLIYDGDTHKGGEIGHMLVMPKGGKRCYCGKTGCFDTISSTEVLVQYSDGSLDDFFKMLKAGNEEVEKVWDTYLENLSIAIHNVHMLVDGKIIIGGYLGAYIGDYLDDLRERVDSKNPFDGLAKDYVLECTCKVEAVASGAGIYYIDRFIENI